MLRRRTARNPYVRGDVGPAQVSQAPDETNLYDDGWYTTLELVAVQPTRVAMVQLTVDDPDVLTPGTTRTVTANDWDSGVSLLACTGSEVGMYDEYDAPADEVVIVVEEGTTEGEVEVEVTGRWYDRDELGNPQGGSRVATAEATLVP